MSIVTIKLSKPVIGPRGEVTEIQLQPPGYDAYMLNGEPYTVAETADGARYAVESMDVIQAYVAECLVDKSHLSLLSQGDALLGRKVRKAVLGFFQEGGAGTEASPTSPTT